VEPPKVPNLLCGPFTYLMTWPIGTTITANKSSTKHHSADDPGRGPSTKKAKVLDKSPDTLNDVLEPNHTVSFSTEEGDPPATASGEDSAPKDDDSAPKDDVSTSRIDDSAPNVSVSTTGNDDSGTKGCDSSIGANDSATKDNVGPTTDADPLTASEPPVGIRYFENCLSWIVDLDYDSFRFIGKGRPKLMEHYTNPEGREVKQDAKLLIQGYLDTSGFYSLEETNRYEDNPKAKAHYGCRLYLMDKDAAAVRRLYETGPMAEDMKGSISLKQDVGTLARVSTRPNWDVQTDGFPFLYEGSLYAGGLAGPPLMPNEFHTGDLVVAEFTIQGYSFNGREGYTLGLCSLYKIESGSGVLPVDVTDGPSQDTLFAAETPRRMRAPRPVF